MNSKKSQAGGIALWLLIAIFLVGVVSLIYGLSSTDSQPDFALLTVSFLFLLGISQAGVVFTAVLRLVESDWGKPWYRIAELSTLAFFPFAILGFLLIYYYGQEDLFYWLHPAPDEHLSPWLDINWLLIRDLGGLVLFYGLALVYVKKGLRPDMAKGNEATAIDHDQVEKELYLFSPIMIIGFIICNTFIAWDFAMMIIPHWHSTIFPIHYWFGNVFAGFAALIAFAVVMRNADGGSHFGPAQIRGLGMLVTGFTLLWLYFFWSQFFVIWFGNLSVETEPVWRQMYGHYSPYFWTMLVGCFFIPFISLLFAVVKRSVFAMCVVAIGINVGIWMNKYLMIVPVFSPDNRPFDHWVDLAVALGLLAGFLATVIILAGRLPKYSAWEMSREA